MTEQTLARARAGDEDAFRELTDPYRRELQLHVYRIVGSAQDAEDLLQETLLAAWRGLERFEGRASVRAWLYRIATNRSLDALRASRRRPEDLPRMTEVPEPTRRAEPIWLEPYPDVLLEGIPDEAPGPERATRPRRRSRWRSSSAFSTSRRSSARCSCCATCSASVPRRSPRCSRPASPRSTASCAARVRRSSPPARRRTRTRAAPELQARARRRRPLRRRGRGGRHRRHGRPAHRRRLGDDAARALGVPGRHRDRRVPTRPRGRRGAPLRLVPTRANGQPAFGAICRVRKPISRGRTRCSSSRSSATGSPRSPGSPTAASSRSSDCRGRCDRRRSASRPVDPPMIDATTVTGIRRDEKTTTTRRKATEWR